jgi:cyclopropane fatty-acyl-phospholipid synthase-like methyltransferase
MLHKSSLDPGYFAALYAANPDPWNFETSAYERAKYDHTLAALPRPSFGNALEIGCANGVLTERLAGRCDRLVAVDVVDQALDAARRRCMGLPWVTVEKAQIPRDRIEGVFDLILISEVAYYWDDGDLAATAGFVTESTKAGGCLMLVHWTGETDYPKSADEAVTTLRSLTRGDFDVLREERLPEYRLDVWQRCGRWRRSGG